MGWEFCSWVNQWAHQNLIGCFLLQPGYPATSRRRLFAAGILLGLVCLLRIHLAPAVAIVMLWASWSQWRERLPALVAGGLAVTVFGAVLDWLTLGYPLASLWRNFLYNVIDGVMYTSGTWGYVYAVNAATGKEIWRYDPQAAHLAARHPCCDLVNRGVAVWKGRVYVASVDGRLHAIDAASVSIILASSPGSDGLARAIHDRLMRAADGRIKTFVQD